MPPPSLADLPLEVIIDNLLPVLPLRDLFSLAATSLEYAAICSDDTFWKRKLKEDYNFADAASARTKGYKFLYKGVHNAKLYVWGSAGEGRLGLERVEYGGIRAGSVPYPTQLAVPGPRIVELAAGGWSFHALNSEGSVHVWGRLDGLQIGGLHGDPFSFRTKQATSPTRLILPEPISKISCGRSHAAALSSRGRVWVFPSWGRPYVLTTPLVSPPDPLSTPLQVECGWSFSAVLTSGGDVYVWWPFDGVFGELLRAHDEGCDADPGERVQDGEEGVWCRTWEVGVDPSRVLPVATALPGLRRGEEGEEGVGVGERIVKIAAGDDFLVGLTEGGHVLKVNFPGGQASFSSPLRRPRWEYLEQFSETRHVQSHATFGEDVPAPESLTITHISAHFLTFFAYSTGASSIILQGAQDTLPSSTPTVPRALQHKDVIAMILGDYHYGALTATGTLLTWGAYSSGALGLGDPTRLPVGSPGGYARDDQRQRARRTRIVPPGVEAPSAVRFGRGAEDGSGGRRSFVFAATAAGWHTGALVIDLEDGEEDPREDGEDDEERESDVLQPSWGGQMPFRVGLAGAWGRGRRPGRGRG